MVGGPLVALPLAHPGGLLVIVAYQNVRRVVRRPVSAGDRAERIAGTPRQLHLRHTRRVAPRGQVSAQILAGLANILSRDPGVLAVARTAGGCRRRPARGSGCPGTVAVAIAYRALRSEIE
jgi:hypothetical protein